nr:hypothetical protein [uncultured Methanoregula sp.]
MWTPESASINQKVLVTPMPVVLSYFAENGRGTRTDITRAVFKVASKLSKTNIRMDAVFRGNLSTSSKGVLTSETVDSELYFWLSNDFLKECEISDSNDICYEVNSSKSFDNYRIENLSKRLNEINWNEPTEKQTFLKILGEAIGCAKV